MCVLRMEEISIYVQQIDKGQIYLIKLASAIEYHVNVYLGVCSFVFGNGMGGMRASTNCAFVHIPIDAISIHNENKAKRTNNNKNSSSSGGSSSCSDSETRLNNKTSNAFGSKFRNESEYLFIQREIVRANILCLMVALQNHAWWSLAIWLASSGWNSVSSPV